MKYEETFTESNVDVVAFLKKAVPATFVSALKDAGESFDIPADRELEYKVKYDAEGGSALIKVTWDTLLEGEEEEEEEDKEED